MKILKIFILIIPIFLLFNCVIIEKAGQVLDGSAFKLKTVSVYEASGKGENQQEIKIFVVEKKDKEKSIIITLENFPMIKLLGSFPDEEGAIFLTSIEFLAGSDHGWNEYTLELMGTGNLKFDGTATLKIEEIEPVQITKGRVQRYDTRLTGNEALSVLRNRRERVLAVTEWMASFNPEKGKIIDDIDDFEAFWRPILLPETVSKKKRPDGWIQDTDKFQKADSIRWNTGYTERTFSKELWPIRNSGTLLRDWEEAIAWIYLEYEWKNIVELLSKEIIFTKIK
ncbi:hypothetical protein R84B8_00795 [Treponema sp. R8-4-B8]